MSTPLTPPTPEGVAETFTAGDNDFLDGDGWKLSLTAKENVVSIGITPYDEDGNPVDEVHFRAHVFQVEPGPPVATEPVLLDPEDARELAYLSVGTGFDEWTVVAREDLGSTRWEAHRRLVIRNKAGEHFAATYSKGLTEYQSNSPWEGEETARFEPVTRRTKVVQAHEWIAPASLSDTGEADTRG